MAPSAHGDADSFLGRSRSSFAGLPPPEPPALEPMSPQYGIQDTMITALLSQTRAPEPTPLHLKRPQSAMRAQEQEPPLALALRRGQRRGHAGQRRRLARDEAPVLAADA